MNENMYITARMLAYITLILSLVQVKQYYESKGENPHLSLSVERKGKASLP